jgi:hypothetical protein
MGEPYTSLIRFRDGHTETFPSEHVENLGFEGVGINEGQNTRRIPWADIAVIEIFGSQGGDTPITRWNPPRR